MDTPIDGWELGDHQHVESNGIVPFNLAPYITDKERWKNYTNDILYELECMLREFISSQPKTWYRCVRKRRYTFSMMFLILIGHKFDIRKDAKYMRPLSTLMNYYSTRIVNSTTIDGVKTNSRVYVLSKKRLERPAYSLRLRIEMMNEAGRTPDPRSLRINDAELLKPGHARNPQVDANIEKRRAIGRATGGRWMENGSQIED